MEAVTSGLIPAVESPNGELGTWATEFIQLAEVAASLALTSFVPDSLRVFDRGQPNAGATAAQVTAAMMTGRELGFKPMASLGQFAVIQGRPALSALGLRALVQQRGHQIRVVEQTNTRAIVEGKRADDTEWQRVTWTMDDARSRGLAGRDNWKKMPRNMMVARATSEVARLIAADAILGVAYSVEELEDSDVDQGAEEPVPVTSGLPATRSLRRRRVPKPTLVSASAPLAEAEAEGDEPPLDDAVDAQDASDAITPQQMKALQAGFKELGLERPARLAFVTAVIERDVRSAKDLSTAEASQVLAEIGRTKALRDEADPDPEEQEVLPLD
jgi:hypothetical protein